MPIVVRKGANTSYHGSGQLIEATRATIAAMRSTTAECRHLVEVSRSTIADTRTSIREVNALLRAAMFQFELTSINQASPDRCRDAHAVVLLQRMVIDLSGTRMALSSMISRLPAAKLSRAHAN